MLTFCSIMPQSPNTQVRKKMHYVVVQYAEIYYNIACISICTLLLNCWYFVNISQH